MKTINIQTLKRKYKGIDDEYALNAEMFIRFFNFWPEVQKKWLKLLGYKKKEIEKIMNVSDRYAKTKIRLINKRLPKKREQVIIIENDALEGIYKPRILFINEPKRDLRLKNALKWLKKEYKGEVILDPARIDKFEKFMKEKGTGVDIIVITDKEILAYQVEAKKA